MHAKPTVDHTDQHGLPNRKARFAARRPRVWLVIAALTSGLSLMAVDLPVARAQESAQVLASRALFEEGRRLLAEGRYAEACVKLEESQSLRSGIGTQFNLAECHEKLGHTASAWSLYLRVASETKALGQAEREQVARTRAAALETQLSRLTLNVEALHVGLEITLDGASMTPATWGIATPIDPGDHQLVASAPGYQTWKGVVHIDAAASAARVSIPALRASLAFPAAALTSEVSPATSNTPNPVEDAGANAESSSWPYVVGGVGVAGVVLGGLFGLRALDKNADAEKICADRPNRCPAAEIDKHEELLKAARGARTAGYVSFGLGLVGVGVSAVWLLSDDADNASAHALRLYPSVGTAGAGLSLDGTF